MNSLTSLVEVAAPLDLHAHWVGVACLALFFGAYLLGGLGLLTLYSHLLNRGADHDEAPMVDHGGIEADTERPRQPMNVFHRIARAEWGTLLIFYGIIPCVSGLALIGCLASASQLMSLGLGPTVANVLVGIFSAVVDNIPVMYAVPTMQPATDHGQWLMVALTAGVGGSLLAVGSAASVAVMTQRGVIPRIGR